MFMKIYSAEISDMKVTVFSNGLDNHIKKVGFELACDEDFSDSDVLVVFSAEEDKAAKALLDRIYSEGVVASLVLSVYQRHSGECHPVLDSIVISQESTMADALSDLLELLDYYSYINTADIGALLSDRGKMMYQMLSPMTDLSEAAEKTAECIGSSDEAIVLLKVPEDVWISDVEGFAYDLSEKAPNTNTALSAVRIGEKLSVCAFLNV